MHRDTQPGRALLLIALLAPLNVARADPSVVTMNGVPAQVIPSIPEVGAPTFVTPAGAGFFMGDGGGPNSADGSTSTDGSTGTSNSSTDWSGYSGGGTQAMDAMMATPYGNLAASAATQLGLNPEAMAGLGQLESGFRNVGTANGASSATEPWQITSGTWADTVAKYNLPYTASDITNPAAQTQVASYIAKDYSNAVSNKTGQPATVLQTYGAWVFGPSPGGNMARADTSVPLSSFVSAQALSNNNMTGWTVGQFYSTFGNKLGSGANQTVQAGL
jgi:hypothetical protein